MKNTKHIHRSVILVFIALVVVSCVCILYGYVQKHIKVSMGKVIETRQTIQQQELSLSKENDFVEIHKETMNDRAKLKSFFIEDDNAVSFIEAVEDLGSKVGSSIVLSSIEADSIENSEPGTTGKIRARVNVQGSWIAVIKTLKMAENLPYGITVYNVRLDSSDGTMDGKTGKKEWKASFTIEGLLIRAKL